MLVALVEGWLVVKSGVVAVEMLIGWLVVELVTQVVDKPVVGKVINVVAEVVGMVRGLVTKVVVSGLVVTGLVVTGLVVTGFIAGEVGSLVVTGPQMGQSVGSVNPSEGLMVSSALIDPIRIARIKTTCILSFFLFFNRA